MNRAKRYGGPMLAIFLLIMGVHKRIPENLSLESLPSLWSQSPERELERLENEYEEIKAELVKDSKALKRAETHFTMVLRRGLRGPALERVRAPIYHMRHQIDEKKEKIAVMEQRLEILRGGEEIALDAPAEEAGGFK